MKIKTETYELDGGIVITEAEMTYGAWWKDIIEFLFSAACFCLTVLVAATLDPWFGLLWTFGHITVGVFRPSALQFRLFPQQQAWSYSQTENANGAVLIYTDSWGVRWVHPELETAMQARIDR